MPKGKRGKPPEEKASSDVIQFRPSVDVSNGRTELPAVDLTQIDPTEAVKVLVEVAALNDRAILAFKAFEKSNKETKQCKAKWEELSQQVQSRLKELTHPTELPLFDEKQAEQDLSRIQQESAPPPPFQPLEEETPF